MQKLTIIIFLLIYNLNFGQEKVYNLISKTENSDINYKAFEKFDDFKIYENDGLKKAFEPIKGDFNVYFFIAEFKGDSFDGTRKTFHDYLILKVDPKTELIVDGFQYSLEWAEPPAISDLYKVTDKNQKINNGIYLNSLKMELVEQEKRTYGNEKYEEFMDAQFELYKQTDKYKKEFIELKKNDDGEEEYEDRFIENLIRTYTPNFTSKFTD